MSNRQAFETYVSFHLPPDLKAKLQALAKAQDLTLAQLMRKIATKEVEGK